MLEVIQCYGIVILLVVVGLFVYGAAETIRNKLRASKVRQIIKQGGPRTLDEYLLLFPDACPTCGSRELLETIQTTGSQEGGGYAESSDYRRACKRCGHVIKESPSGWAAVGEPQTQVIEVHSPYLTREQEIDIPIWSPS